jgi:hypothetical protein
VIENDQSVSQRMRLEVRKAPVSYLRGVFGAVGKAVRPTIRLHQTIHFSEANEVFANEIAMRWLFVLRDPSRIARQSVVRDIEIIQLTQLQHTLK